MTQTAIYDSADTDLPAALKTFFTSVLELDTVSALLIPQHLPMNPMVMPMLVTDPDRLEGVDPLAPAFPMNASKLAARISRKPIGGTVVAVMRPCEIRAFIELVKLKQGRTEDLILVSFDCPGALKNTDYIAFAGEEGMASTTRFLKTALSGEPSLGDGIQISTACQACEHPVADGADLVIGLLGMKTDGQILIKAQSEKGEALFDQLNLKKAAEPETRKAAIEALVSTRVAYRDRLFETTRNNTDTLEKLTRYLAACVNCYNCRVACPVCYCRECVFVTDIFDHEPNQYLRWANRKGAIKMPTDTVFYHITRLAHMSTACVGCGQCSNACPNDIPLADLFKMTGQRTQAAFDYEAGRSLEESPPLSVFREDEFPEVTGGKN